MTNTKWLVFAALFGLVFARAADAVEPYLEYGGCLRDGADPLRPWGTDPDSRPCVVDWNNDGKKDLLVGTRSGGKVLLYLNKGTDGEPMFNGYSCLKAGGRDISMGGT